MSIAGPSYQIAQPTRKCSATGRELLPGERYVATLVETPDSEELARLDFSQESWTQGRRPQPPLALFGFWQSTIEDPTKPAKQLLDDEELLDLFDQLVETTQPRRIAFRFVLALALIRKRLLVYEGGTPADPKRKIEGSMLVRRRSEKEATPIEVKDPGMDDDAIEAATDQIGQIMNLDAATSKRKDS
jgi:hypothetical protein